MKPAAVLIVFLFGFLVSLSTTESHVRFPELSASSSVHLLHLCSLNPYLEKVFLSQKLHSKILCFSSLCSTKILSSFVSNWHFSQVNPPSSSAQSQEGGFNQDIDDDVYDDVNDGVKAHDVSHLRLLSPAPLSLEPRISLPTSFLSRPIVLGRTF